MSSLIRNSKKHSNHLRLNLQSLLAALLLVVYTTGTIGLDFMHHVFHDHSGSALHSPTLELDPCHRAVHHQDLQNGCKHQAHFTNTEKCTFDHAIFQPHACITFYAISKPSFGNKHVFSIGYFSAPGISCFKEPLRGPPTA